MLESLGLEVGRPWTKNAPVYGGTLDRQTLLARAEDGPATVPPETRRRWAFTYGDQIEALYARVGADPAAVKEVAAGVLTAELQHTAEVEDAVTAEDFLLRRTKFQLLLDEAGQDSVRDWFAMA